MTTIVDEIPLKARLLPPEDRPCIAGELLASLQEDADPAVEAAWDIEIRRRGQEIQTPFFRSRPPQLARHLIALMRFLQLLRPAATWTASTAAPRRGSDGRCLRVKLDPGVVFPLPANLGRSRSSSPGRRAPRTVLNRAGT